MSIALDNLTLEVQNMTTVADSFLAYHDKLVAELRANATDPAALNKLADDLAAKRVALANAMSANTAADAEPIIAESDDTQPGVIQPELPTE